LIDTRQNLQSIQPTFLEIRILFYFTGALNTVHLRRKCWSVVNFIVALSTRVAPHSSSEICRPFFENAGTRPGQTIAQGEQVFRGKEALQ
jgi:hypothetical protein